MDLRRRSVIAVVLLLGGLLAGCDVAAPPERVITYRIATRGVITADLGHFARHVASTLADPRGWSAGGAIQFRQVAGPADFTIWLAEASTLPSFGSPCHPRWSCRSGSNVIINQDRWQGATSTWPYGLDSYRHYVVNHEVGHWMGLGHLSCTGGAGARAPVMAQQSKGGAARGECRFNVWPTPGEVATASRNRGVTPRYSGVPNPDDPFGSFDSVVVERDDSGRPLRVRLLGWAADGDTRGPLPVGVFLDGKPVTIIAADRPRADLGDILWYLGEDHGVDATIEVPPSTGVVCLLAGGVGAGHGSVDLGCKVVK
ncbi:MAG: DUF3152 domain-containing protein [Microthrixaceae bacterium]|nr:DUF3152 domain-containing protein [Microthrixaceae bacterium]